MNSGIGISRPGLRVVLGMMFVMVCADPLAAQVNGAFSATDGHIVVPYAPVLDFGAQLTIEAWIRPGPLDGAFGAIVDKDYNVGYCLGVESLHPVPDSVRIRCKVAGVGTVGPIIPADGNTWTHVAATVDTVAHMVIFYVNGHLEMTSTGPAVRFSVVPENLMIGRSKYGDKFNGLIDEVRIWNVVRSQSEIASLYSHEAKGDEPGLVAVYHFEDSRDTVAWNRAAGGGLNGSFGASGWITMVPWEFSMTLPWTFAFADEHEPNDTYANATPMDHWSRFAFASVAPGDTDTYKIYMREGDVIQVATAEHIAGDQIDLGMSVVGPDSTTVLRTVDYTFPSVHAVPTFEGYRYIRVYAGTTGSGGSYEIYNRRRDPLEADPFEPNDSFGSATPMTWGTVITPTIYPGIDVGIAVPDTDYFSFSGQAGEIALVPYSYQGAPSGSPGQTVFGPGGKMTKSFNCNVPNFLLPATDTYYARMHTAFGAVRYRFGLFKGLLDINGMLYDPCGYGGSISLYDGWGHAYDQGYSLTVNGGWYGAAADYSIIEADGRQFVFLPKLISGLNVSRKFYVPAAAQGDTLGFIRIQDILSNPTGAPITVTVGVRSDIGSQTTVNVLGTSDGDTQLTTADTWALTANIPSNDMPALTHVFDGVGGADRVDSISIVEDFLYWEWRDVTVPAGETRILMYFAAQDSSETNAYRKGPAFGGSVLPAAAIIGLGDDAYRVINWPTDPLVGVAGPEEAPGFYSLAQNYPNPFNPTTTIRFTLPGSSGRGGRTEREHVRLAVYDILGRQVAVPVDEERAPGSYEVKLDARNLASGIYMYRLTAGPFAETKKMVLMR